MWVAKLDPLQRVAKVCSEDSSLLGENTPPMFPNQSLQDFLHDWQSHKYLLMIGVFFRSPAHQLLIALPDRPKTTTSRESQSERKHSSTLLSALFRPDHSAQVGSSVHSSLQRRIVIGPNALVVGSFTSQTADQSWRQRRLKRVKRCQKQEVKSRRCMQLLKRMSRLGNAQWERRCLGNRLMNLARKHSFFCSCYDPVIITIIYILWEVCAHDLASSDVHVFACILERVQLAFPIPD